MHLAHGRMCYDKWTVLLCHAPEVSSVYNSRIVPDSSLSMKIDVHDEVVGKLRDDYS